jgi:hypothetical protein
MTRALHRTLWLVGGAMALLALLWWTLVFRSVISYGYLSLPQATLCLGSSSSICELAMSLCSAKIRHWLDVNWYSPKLLWLGLALVFASLTLNPRRT